jgi:hypothetical protein
MLKPYVTNRYRELIYFCFVNFPARISEGDFLNWNEIICSDWRWLFKIDLDFLGFAIS